MAGASSPPSKAPAEPHTPDTEASKAECVCVAVHVRPLVESELAEGCEHALTVTPGLPQVRLMVGGPLSAADEYAQSSTVEAAAHAGHRAIVPTPAARGEQVSTPFPVEHLRPVPA